MTSREELIGTIADSLALSYGSNIGPPKGGKDWRAAENVVTTLELIRPEPTLESIVDDLSTAHTGHYRAPYFTREFAQTLAPKVLQIVEKYR